MAAPSYVFTIAKVALMLGEDEAPLEELALGTEPEDGRFFICDADDDVSVTAFAPFGVEYLKALLDEFKSQRTSRSKELLSAVLTACLLYVEVDETYNFDCPPHRSTTRHDPLRTTKTSVRGAISMLGLMKPAFCQFGLPSAPTVILASAPRVDNHCAALDERPDPGISTGRLR
jgi:hypothetical protein